MNKTRHTIENEIVLRHSDRTVFWCLTVLSSIAILWSVSAWIFTVDWARHPIIFAGITGVGLALLSLNQAHWFILLFMKRPRPMTPEKGWRVAVVTTIVPTFESIDMLEATLKALVGLQCSGVDNGHCVAKL